MSELLEGGSPANCGEDSILDLTATSWFALHKLKVLQRLIEPSEPQKLVLGNYDLLEQIFSCFTQELERGSGSMHAETRQNLLSAAKTCKSFVDPALDILWREVCSLEPLFRLLPPIEGRSRSLSVLPITPEDIQRFDVYARRVRCLRYDPSIPELSSCMFMTVSRRHHYPILPFLQKLVATSVEWSHMDSLPVLFLAISPSLFDVSLEDIKSSNSAEKFITNLLYNILLNAPHVTNLQLSGHLSDKTLDLVKDFQHLKLLSLSIKDQGIANIFDVLSSSSALKSLSITSPVATEWPEPKIFSALQFLTLKCAVEEMSNLLRVIDAPNLVTLSVSTHFGDSGPVGSLALCIKQCTQISQFLHSLILDLPGSQDNATWNLLMPLGRCTQLKKLHITCSSMSFSNDNLTAVCTQGGWRNLESFKFQITTWVQDKATLSLPALRILAECCPRLTSLHFSILIPPEDDDFDELEDEVIHSSHCLEELHIYNIGSRSPGENTEAVMSKYIYLIFPTLKDLQIDFDW